MRTLAALLSALVLVAAALRQTVPTDIAGGLNNPDTATVQHAADQFAWQEFLAITPQWEHWKTPEEVFLPDGAQPPDWDSPRPKEHELSANLQAVQADGTLPPILTDKNGHVVRYEERMNRVAFDYIRSHRLYDSRIQAQTDSVTFPNGSLLVKASWRELEPGEESRFLTRECVVYDVKNGKPGRKRKRRMGLIGLHVVQKTPSAPQWIWATFEHIDNVGGSTEHANRQTRAGVPSHFTRVIPIPTALQALNRQQQQALREQGSVLQNYELIGTQWPTPDSQTLPAYLANTTMETFVQESSCMGCHTMARTAPQGRFVSSDYTFLLSRAEPKLPNPRILPPPTKPKTAWDTQNWRAIQRGHALSERTYELLPEFVGNKLHCGSCHLDSGRNPDSSWWVGMMTKYQYPGTEKFYERINQCMQRSMNGKSIPTDGEAMDAFIAYFRWLDEQYTGAPRPTGMPVVEKREGNALRGETLFAQRCAFCHGKDGQGRYESNTYFRPALWGPHSFNNLAGLGAKPEKMAGFLKYNMPFGSGGALSLQEAWDLTAYLVKQPRPQRAAP